MSDYFSVRAVPSPDAPLLRLGRVIHYLGNVLVQQPATDQVWLVQLSDDGGPRSSFF